MSGPADRSRKPAPRYSGAGVVARAVTRRAWGRAWQRRDLRDGYGVVIVGGGVHGLATAYHLAADHGIRDVAVLERGYVGGGGSGRNTAIIRSNYLTPEGVRFYDRSVALYEGLATQLNFNVMFSQRGHLTLAHDEGALRTLRWRAEVNTLEGVDSSILTPSEIVRTVPRLDVSPDRRRPIVGGLYHPPGGTIRHDAVVWGYARAADRLGVSIHQGVEVTGIDATGDRIRAVETTRGRIGADVVVNCTAGWASTVADMVDLELPIVTSPLQAAVTEPLQPLLDCVVVSGGLHVYVSQTDRGELVFGASVDPFSSYGNRGSLAFVEGLAGNVLELMPSLARARLLRQWAGLCDMTPDYSPIIGLTPVEGFVLDVGWGTYGFKAGPAAGESVAQLVATGEVPELIAPFDLARFADGRLVGERGAASVGH